MSPGYRSAQHITSKGEMHTSETIPKRAREGVDNTCTPMVPSLKNERADELEPCVWDPSCKKIKLILWKCGTGWAGLWMATQIVLFFSPSWPIPLHVRDTHTQEWPQRSRVNQTHCAHGKRNRKHLDSQCALNADETALYMAALEGWQQAECGRHILQCLDLHWMWRVEHTDVSAVGYD